MNEATIGLIAAVITALCSLAGTYFANRKNQALVEYRLKKLEEKVDKHNNLIERTYILEGQMAECQHDIRDIRGKND